MERKNFEKTNWLQVGLMSALIITVVILAAMIFRMDAQLDTLEHPEGQKSATASSPPAAVKSKLNSSDAKTADPSDPNDDWFSESFDPSNWNPFAEMQRMHQRFDNIFNDSFSRFSQSQRFRDLVLEPKFSPKLDVREEKDKFVIRLDLPGVKEGNVDVQVDGKEVQISGKKEDIVANKDKDGHVVQQERHTGTFSRIIDLPEAVDPSKMNTKNENGVFTIVLPKA